jgi:hypothetical protein
VRMNTTVRQTRSPHPNAVPTRPAAEQEFEQIQSPENIVEHLTVPGFLRRVPNRWHLEDIQRFGDKVGRIAESLHIGYLTTVDRSLGQIRVFPVPLSQRIYDTMAPTFGWPQIIDAPAPGLPAQDQANRDALRSHERLSKLLRALLEAAPNLDVQHSTAVVIQWLETDITRIREEIGEPAAPASGETAPQAR